VLWLGLAVLAIVAVELALRALQLAPSAAVATVSQEEFDRLPGIFRPNQTLIDRREPALPHRVTINSLGYRGPDLPRAKTPGECRIVLAGDSFTYGDFVDDTETLPAQLEGALRNQGVNVRAINAGLGGSTITDETHMLERALSVAPDLAIVVCAEEDFSRLGTDSPMWTRLATNRGSKSRFQCPSSTHCFGAPRCGTSACSSRPDDKRRPRRAGAVGSPTESHTVTP
jgi:hypothetical protein